MTGLFPHLPVFLDLAGRAAVLLAGGDGLAPVARRLLDSGAGVTVFDPEPGPEMATLSGSLRLARRRWRTSDLDGAAIVVASPGERRLARARAAARSAGALFVVHGESNLSGVTFGAAAVLGPMAIGVTVSGLAPALGETMARRLEAVVPDAYVRFLAAAASMAADVERAVQDPAQRDAFWRLAAADAFEATPPDWRDWIVARLPRPSATV